MSAYSTLQCVYEIDPTVSTYSTLPLGLLDVHVTDVVLEPVGQRRRVRRGQGCSRGPGRERRHLPVQANGAGAGGWRRGGGSGGSGGSGSGPGDESDDESDEEARP